MEKQNMTQDFEIISLTPSNIAEYGVCGYKNVKKHIELRKKIEWFSTYYKRGLRIKAILSQTGGYQGMIEYIPGSIAHRPVEASGYMFIHCVFVGFKKEFKGKGFASMLIDVCIDDAKRKNMNGAAVVTRKGSFMADKAIFLKKGFVSVDSTKPDFELLVYKFDKNNDNPHFKELNALLKPFKTGLMILRSPQCPYTEKNVNAIMETAKKTFHLKPQVINLDTAEAVQQSPCPFGSFCIIYNGKIISHHPISNTRFENIMKNEM